MKLLSDEEALEWSRSVGIGANAAWASLGTRAEDTRALCFRIQVPGEPTAIIGLAYTIVMTAVADHDEVKFAGALLWLREWEIWSESMDRTGYALLDGVRRLSGDEHAIASAPAQAFGPGEFYLACASLSLPMIFQWDAHFVAADGSHAVVVSHEAYLDFFAFGERTFDDLLTRFDQWQPERVTG